MSELHDSELVHVISHQLKLIRGEIRPCHSLHTPSGVKKNLRGQEGKMDNS